MLYLYAYHCRCRRFLPAYLYHTLLVCAARRTFAALRAAFGSLRRAACALPRARLRAAFITPRRAHTYSYRFAGLRFVLTVPAYARLLPLSHRLYRHACYLPAYCRIGSRYLTVPASALFCFYAVLPATLPFLPRFLPSPLLVGSAAVASTTGLYYLSVYPSAVATATGLHLPLHSYTAFYAFTPCYGLLRFTTLLDRATALPGSHCIPMPVRSCPTVPQHTTHRGSPRSHRLVSVCVGSCTAVIPTCAATLPLTLLLYLRFCVHRAARLVAYCAALVSRTTCLYWFCRRGSIKVLLPPALVPTQVRWFGPCLCLPLPTLPAGCRTSLRFFWLPACTVHSSHAWFYHYLV